MTALPATWNDRFASLLRFGRSLLCIGSRGPLFFFCVAFPSTFRNSVSARARLTAPVAAQGRDFLKAECDLIFAEAYLFPLRME